MCHSQEQEGDNKPGDQIDTESTVKLAGLSLVCCDNAGSWDENGGVRQPKGAIRAECYLKPIFTLVTAWQDEHEFNVWNAKNFYWTRRRLVMMVVVLRP